MNWDGIIADVENLIALDYMQRNQYLVVEEVPSVLILSGGIFEIVQVDVKDAISRR